MILEIITIGSCFLACLLWGLLFALYYHKNGYDTLFLKWSGTIITTSPFFTIIYAGIHYQKPSLIILGVISPILGLIIGYILRKNNINI